MNTLTLALILIGVLTLTIVYLDHRITTLRSRREAAWDPVDVIMRGLLAKVTGEPVDEDEVQCASMVLATAALISRGVDQDTAMRAVESAAENGTIHISYSPVEGLEVTIERGGDDA